VTESLAYAQALENVATFHFRCQMLKHLMQQTDGQVPEEISKGYADLFNSDFVTYVKELCLRFQDYGGQQIDIMAVGQLDGPHDAQELIDRLKRDLYRQAVEKKRKSKKQEDEDDGEEEDDDIVDSEAEEDDDTGSGEEDEDSTSSNIKIEPPKKYRYLPNYVQLQLLQIKKALLKRTAALAIRRLFELNPWLDAITLQEVKYSGIEVLEYLGGVNGFTVFRGPLLKGGNEVEYYPLILRGDCMSGNHFPRQKLVVTKIWWIPTQGGPGAMGSIDEKRKSPDPHFRWKKADDRYRPVVVYDIEIGEGSGVVVHVGVIHTTPSASTLKLPESSLKSIEKLRTDNKRARTKQAPSTELQRLNQFSQLQNAFDKITTCAYANDEDGGDYFGPWILAGDYYLFRESRVVDIHTLYLPETDKFKEPYQTRLLKEFDECIATLNLCLQSLGKFKERQRFWQETCDRIRSLKRREMSDGLDFERTCSLDQDNRVLASESVDEEPGIRAIIRRHYRDWLDDSPLVKQLSQFYWTETREGWFSPSKRQASWPEAIKLSLYARGFDNVCEARAGIYSDVVVYCMKMVELYHPLSEVKRSESKLIYLALLQVNERLKPNLDKKTRKTVQNINFDKIDPTRTSLGLTFEKVLDSKLEVTQAISGSNTNKFEKLSIYREGNKERFRFLATRLKIADFFIGTRYDAKTGFGSNHWTCNCVGMMCPLTPGMVLADDDKLTISRFWAAISDHFPIGGYYSTDMAENEMQFLRLKCLRLVFGDDTQQEALKLLEQMEWSRRLFRLVELQKLAHLLLAFENSLKWDQKKIGDNSELYGWMYAKGEEMSTSQLNEAIATLELLLHVPEKDRFGQLNLKLEDFEAV